MVDSLDGVLFVSITREDYARDLRFDLPDFGKECYSIHFGHEIMFPGESFIGRNKALNTAFYLIAGVGKTRFAGDDRFTVNFGAGMRFLPLDWLAIHIDVRDHIQSWR